MYATWIDDDWKEEEKIDPVYASQQAARAVRRARRRAMAEQMAEYKAEEGDFELGVLLTERLENRSHPSAAVLRDGWMVPGKPLCRASNRRGNGNAKPIRHKPWQTLNTFHRP